MKPFRVLVTGWRDWPEDRSSVIERALDGVAWFVSGTTPNRPIVVVQGECPYGGVDLHAKRWAERTPGTSVESHPAEVIGDRIQGPARNSVMVNLGADLCLAFPGPNSRGTWDCVRKAVDADIPTQVHAWCTEWYAEPDS
jgi:hypothetical protein